MMAQFSENDRRNIIRYFNDQEIVSKIVDLISRYQEDFNSFASPPFGAAIEIISFMVRQQPIINYKFGAGPGQ